MNTPVTLPLPEEMQRCLAHGLYQGDTCHQADKCARHVTIRHDVTTITPMYRACNPETMALFVPVDGFPDDEVKA